MLRKILIALFILIIGTIAAFFGWRYVGYVRDPNPNKTFLSPQLALSQIEITSLTVDKAEINARLTIQNHLPISFTADSLHYSFFVNNRTVLRSQYDKKISLRANGRDSILLPITILHRDFINGSATDKRRNVDSVEYRLQASFYTNLPFAKKFDVNVSALRPVFKVPEAKVENLIVDSLNFSRALIRVFVSIDNRNDFGLKAKDISYECSIQGHDWIRGTIPGHVNLRAKGLTEFEMPLHISIKELIVTIFSLLKKSDSTQYKLRLVFVLESGGDNLKNSKVVLESAGSMRSLAKVAGAK